MLRRSWRACGQRIVGVAPGCTDGSRTSAVQGLDGERAVYAAGSFRDTLTIDGHALEMANDDDTVLMKPCS